MCVAASPTNFVDPWGLKINFGSALKSFASTTKNFASASVKVLTKYANNVIEVIDAVNTAASTAKQLRDPNYSKNENRVLAGAKVGGYLAGKGASAAVMGSMVGTNPFASALQLPQVLLAGASADAAANETVITLAKIGIEVVRYYKKN